MASEVPFREARRKFDKLCSEHHHTKNGYYKVVRTVNGKRCSYPIPLVKGRRVKPRHIGRARRRLHISDAEWDAA